MRRYGLTIIIAVLAFSGIGTYYAFGRQHHLPEYKLETIQGDPKEGAAVNLSGSYYGDMRSEPLRVNMDGSAYGGKNTTFRQRLSDARNRSWFYEQPDMQQLLTDHKTFMRGKGNPNGFYRDKEWVIYSDVRLNEKDSTAPVAVFQFHLLNEATGKASKFEQTYKFPEAAKVYGDSHLFIEDVQRLDDEIHLLVKKIDTYNFYSSEYEVFVTDIASGKLLRNEKVGKWTSDEKDVRMQVDWLPTEGFSTPAETIYFSVSEVKISTSTKAGENAESPETLSEKHYSYSYRMGLFAELPEPLWPVDTELVPSLQTDYSYYAEYGPDHITLSRYNLTTKERERAYASLSAGQLGVDEIKAVQIRSNRAYLLINQAGVSGAAVLDIANGKPLFTGRTVGVGDEKQTEEEMRENLHLLNLDIVDKLDD